MYNFWLKKCYCVRKGKMEEVFLVNDRKCFALSYFIFTTQNQVFVSVSSTVKVINVANYQITMLRVIQAIQTLVLQSLRVYIFIHIHTFTNTAQKMKFSIMDFFSKCDQIRRKLQIWSHLLKKFLMEKFSFCEVKVVIGRFLNWLFDSTGEV